MPSKDERIAIVYPWPNLDTVPSLCNAALLLADQGYLVDIFIYTSSEFKRPTFNERINVIVLRNVSMPVRPLSQMAPSMQRCKSGGFRVPSHGFYEVPGRKITQMINFVRKLTHPLKIMRLHRRNPYSCFIGVDALGLLQAYFLSSFIMVPIVYYSLELFLSYEIGTARHKSVKRKEVALSRKAAFVITQDQDRALLLQEDNRIPKENFVLVPNAPLGPACRKPSSYWHQQFGLSSHLRIVLHAGSIDKWTGVEEIVGSVTSWPENWVLVIHARYDAEAHSEVQRLYELAIPGRVFLSPKPVSRQEYDGLVDGADIGVAFYFPVAGSPSTQRNIRTVGLSSGKIAYYLRAGLPVIVNDSVSISELVRYERCGISVGEGQHIGRAIIQIAEDYNAYSERSRKAFDKHFDFRRSFQEVISRIDSLDRKIA